MKKLFFILLASSLLVMCKSASTKTAADKPVAEVQYKDDFKSADAAEKKALLSKLKATGKGYSVLIFTKNFIGEKVVASNAKKTLYSGYVISDPKTGIAEKIRIDNSVDTKVYDTRTKKEVVVDVKNAQKYKFIYLMKNNEGDSAFLVTYSNTLRPLE